MQTILHYHIQETLHESNTSLVYRARHQQQQHSVILKLLKDPFPSPQRIAWFKREFDITRALDLDSVVKAYHLHHLTSAEAHPYGPWMMVLEDFGGESLNRLGLIGNIDRESFLQLAMTITDTLGHIHQHNIIHKDINPSNIILNPATNQVKIIDFGISTRLSRANHTLGATQIIQGTPAYLSPEQTGRMNRPLDYRTDFYSLGMTFYELMTGALPFQADNMLELIHSHIARTPPPAHEVAPHIPPELSRIIDKLMAKNAEDRYQSAYGLKADLEELQNRLEHPTMHAFTPGQHDLSDHFAIPNKLYGREWEIETLLAAFERTCRKSSEMMLITGVAGIGKSVLVHELAKPIAQHQSTFLTGKFDQFLRDTPYVAFIQALTPLVRQILTESESNIAYWRETLQQALGRNGQIMIDVLPDLELIIGPQPTPPTLPPTETQNRFSLIFQQFIQTLATLAPPLVLFLDDLQWADRASLKLIELLITNPQSQHILIIGAYRHNEITPTHPLTYTLKTIAQADATINNLLLEPLDQESIVELLRDTLHTTEDRVDPLACLLVQKTAGNPFFMNEFLKTLYVNGLITFHYDAGQWQWDIAHIEAQDMTDNVIELMNSKLLRLHQQTQDTLQLAACIGNHFDLATITTVSQTPTSIIASHLEQALQEGLIIPLNDTYQLMTLDVPGLSDEVTVEYKFAHDRIQQAVYDLLSPENEQTIHWRIGTLLLAHAHGHPLDAQNLYDPDPLHALEGRIFDIANHLNKGQSCITQLHQIVMMAHVNLIAGQKARNSAAYQPAYTYVNAGIQMLQHPILDSNPWDTFYALTLDLHIEAASTAYLSGHIDAMYALSQEVMTHATSLLDKARVYEIQIQAAIAQNQMPQAIEIGLQLLELLETPLPHTPTPDDIGQALHATANRIQHDQIHDLSHQTTTPTPHHQATMQTFSALTTPAYQAAPQLLPLIVCAMVNHSITEGNTPESAFAYAMYGLILCGVVGDLETGYQFGQLATTVLANTPTNQNAARTLHVVGCNVQHWKEHVRETLAPLQEAYQSGLETGDFNFASLAIMCYCYHSYFSGKDLTLLQQEMHTYQQAITRLDQQPILHFHQIYHQSVLNMLGQNSDPARLIGTVYDEDTMLPLHQQANQRTAIFVLYLNKLLLAYTFGDYAQALDCATSGRDYEDGAVGLILLPIFYLYDSLTRLALLNAASPPDQTPDTPATMHTIAANLEKMRQWAHHSPANHQHKLHLVEAERARIESRHGDAREHYDQAITLARANHYLNEAALANELAGVYYLARGQHRIAHIYLHDAHYLYLQWGALPKTRQLEEHYGHIINQHSTTSGNHLHTTVRLRTTQENNAENLDLTSVIKASQTISGEILLPNLLSNIMNIVIENAGAERGLLLLDHDGTFFVEAEATINHPPTTYHHAIPIGTPHTLPMPISIITYVARTHYPIVLHDAVNEGDFTQEPYIQQHQTRSILCIPLTNQGKSTGLLYLENNLTAHVFTANRLQILNLLSSQAAISLENARLYQDLQTNEKKYRTLFEESKDIIFISDTAGHLIDFNPATTVQSGYTEQELRSFNLRDLYPNRNQQLRLRHTIAQQGSVRDFPIQLRTKEGTIRDVTISATPRYTDHGAIDGYQGIIHDITEQKRAEQEKLRLTAIERELTLAREIQHNMLPPPHPQWQGLDIVCYSQPAHEIGGDLYAYYAFTPASGNNLSQTYAIAIGDVSGNGMPAALLMAVSLTSFYSTVRQHLSPNEFLSAMDNAITEYTRTTPQNCAMVYLEITRTTSYTPVPASSSSVDPPRPPNLHITHTCTLRAANAGCVIPIIKRTDGRVFWIDVIGVPLGVGLSTPHDYRQATLSMHKGDLIVLTSDGVIESFNQHHEMFGFDRLEETVRNGPQTSAEAMLHHIKQHVHAFVGSIQPHDDLTIIVIQT